MVGGRVVESKLCLNKSVRSAISDSFYFETVSDRQFILSIKHGIMLYLLEEYTDTGYSGILKIGYQIDSLYERSIHDDRDAAT